MKNFIKLFCTTLFCLLVVAVSAQEEQKTNDPAGWKKASKQYQQKGYMASASNYQMKHDEGEMTVEVMARVANSYRLNGESELAEYWFAKCMNNNTNADDLLHYAEVLQSNGKCEDAARWFNEYKKIVRGKKRDFVTDCSEMDSFEENDNINIENVKSLNTKHLDYSAVEVEGGVMFTSTRRSRQGASRMTDNWTNDNFSDIYFAASNDEGVLSTPEPLGSEINKKYHDGATSVSEEGTIMYFSRNNSSTKGKGKIVDLKIYSATKTNRVWKNVTELPINNDNYATCHPSISNDGKRLFFSSDRPGGFGGMDIYVSINENGNWQTPVNLGPTVNTSGNEIFPFISPAGNLFFSSNGHKGLGGLDIFKVEQTDKNDEASWLVRSHMGKNFNTKKDDFGFTGNIDMTKGFLTSNRPGGKGSDDIYMWTSTNKESVDEEVESKINVLTQDATTSEPIRNAIVTVKDENNNIVKNNATTNAEGLFIHEVEKGKTYQVTVAKEGYKTVEKTMTVEELLENESFVLNMEKTKCVELAGTVVNEKYKKGIPKVKVTLMNKCTGEKTVVTTNADGTFDFCLDQDCDFEILANKDEFEETQTMVSTINLGTDASTKNIKMELLPKTTKVAVVPNKVNTNPATTTTSTVGSVISNSSLIKVGKVIDLQNIYYDYNKFNIRMDASIELDYIVEMMQNNPKMEIILSAHTDSRGERLYNQVLSARRAESARQYLIKKGIQGHRVKSIGYGESKLKNNCDDNTKCTDKMHQVNRRTEVQITKVN